MVSIRLEKFAYVHHSEPGARLVSCEEMEAVRKEAYESGIREGATAASEAFSSEQSRCLSRIQEAIGDTFFAREEAHRLALSSLRPLVETLTKAIAPALCNSGLSAEIAEIVEEATTRAPDELLTIFVPPSVSDGIEELLKMSNPSVSILEDSTLEDTQARVSWGGGFDLIDLGAASDSAIAAISEFFAEIDHAPELEIQHAN